MNGYKTDKDVSTPARFEDAANEFVKKHGTTDPRIYMYLMINLMEDALKGAAYEKGVDILEAGYTEALLYWNEERREEKA